MPAGRPLIYQLQLMLHLCSLKLRFSESVVSWPISKQTQPRATFVKSKVKVKDPRSSASNKYPAEAFGQGLRPDLRFSSASLSILPTIIVSFCQNMAPHFWRRGKKNLPRQVSKRTSVQRLMKSIKRWKIYWPCCSLKLSRPAFCIEHLRQHVHHVYSKSYLQFQLGLGDWWWLIYSPRLVSATRIIHARLMNSYKLDR